MRLGVAGGASNRRRQCVQGRVPALVSHGVALRKLAAYEMRIDGAVDDGVRHMNDHGAELTGHALRQAAQSHLPVGKACKVYAAPQEGAGAGKDDGYDQTDF